MKNKLIYVIGILIVFTICILIFNIVKSNNEMNILKNNKEEVKVLKEIYKDFIGNLYNSEECSIKLDESCLKNFITNEAFDIEEREELIKCEKKSNSELFSYVIYLKYNNDLNITLTMIRNDQNESEERTYRVYVKNGTIKYEKNGLGNTMYTTPK